MPAPIRTLEDTIAWEVARLGISRHDPRCDWSGGYNVNDCALFQSTAIWGQKVAWNVDVFSRVDGGTYHPGSAGIRRGDVLLYGWTPGRFDHTEMALAAPQGANVQTIGANGSDTIAVAYRTRPIKYVTGFFRPAYLNQEDDMPLTQQDYDGILSIAVPVNGQLVSLGMAIEKIANMPLALLTAAFDSGQKNPDGTARQVQVWQALRDGAYTYGDILHAQLVTITGALSKIGLTLTDAQIKALAAALAKEMPEAQLTEAQLDAALKNLTLKAS
jgi:hypothetical protein